MKKPKPLRVFSNLAISLDGKIASRREPARALGTVLDRKTMHILRAQAQAVIVGAGTMKAHPLPLRIKGSKQKLVNVVVTASGRLPADAPFWEAKDVTRFVFTTERGFEAALRASRDRAFVIPLGGAKVDLAQALGRLQESGITQILVEGGGELMAAFLEAGLLDELYVTLTPWIVGGTANPTLVGGKGLPQWRGLRLNKSRRVKNELYLHYSVLKDR